MSRDTKPAIVRWLCFLGLALVAIACSCGDAAAQPETIVSNPRAYAAIATRASSVDARSRQANTPEPR